MNGWRPDSALETYQDCAADISVGDLRPVPALFLSYALRPIAILASIALTGCVSPGVEIPKTVNVPTPIPCITPADKPERPPLLSDGELLALDSYRATWALWGDRLERQAYESRLEAIAEGCSRIPR